MGFIRVIEYELGAHRRAPLIADLSILSCSVGALLLDFGAMIINEFPFSPREISKRKN
jgi:hypothetical protein